MSAICAIDRVKSDNLRLFTLFKFHVDLHKKVFV
jgi:hypothetical protein